MACRFQATFGEVARRVFLRGRQISIARAGQRGPARYGAYGPFLVGARCQEMIYFRSTS